MTRSSDRIKHYSRHDFPDFAQEFLRRNPEYRKQFQSLSPSAEAGSSSIASDRVARAWGLHFPVQSGH